MQMDGVWVYEYGVRCTGTPFAFWVSIGGALVKGGKIGISFFYLEIVRLSSV